MDGEKDRDGQRTRLIWGNYAIDSAVGPANLVLGVVDDLRVRLLLPQLLHDGIAQHNRRALDVLASHDIDRALARRCPRTEDSNDRGGDLGQDSYEGTIGQ